MGNEMTVATLGDAVKDRVKKAIFDSIPDAAVQQLIENEFKKLTAKEQYGDRLSPLEQIIQAEIRKQMSERINQDIVTYLDLTYQNKSKELVDAAIKQLAPLFMAGMVENFASAAVQGLRNQLSQKGIYL
jgi:PHP family Zn ribbon phosphoesterase